MRLNFMKRAKVPKEQEKEKKVKTKKSKTTKDPEEKEKEKNVKTKKPKTKKLRTNRFAACLRRAWRAFTGCVRCRTHSPERSSELPGPSAINTVANKEQYKEDQGSNKEQTSHRQLSDSGSSDSEDMVFYDTVEYMEDDESKCFIAKSHQDGDEDRSSDRQLRSHSGSSDSEDMVFYDTVEYMEDDESKCFIAKSHQDGDEDRSSDRQLRSHSGSSDSEDMVFYDAVEYMEDDESKCFIAKSHQDSDEDRSSDPKCIASHHTEKDLFLSCHRQEEENVYSVLPSVQSGFREQMGSIILERNSNLLEISSGKNSNQPDNKASDAEPLSLSNFTILKTLGQGAFGKILLARHNIRKENVALKEVDKMSFVEAGGIFAERDVLQLSHESPFLIHGLAAFQTLRCLYFVMEYASGGDLSQLMHNNYPLADDTIQFIMAELICGVKFLHSKGIIHGDLKPENILLTSDGHIKIADFGVADTGVIDGMEIWGLTGTPGYQAPEMLRGEAYGFGADYFSIGVICYELCKFNSPFNGNNADELKHSIVHDEPKIPDNMPSCTSDLIKKLLCKDPLQRLGINGDVTEHPYFSNLNWEDIQLRKVEPPTEMIDDDDSLSSSFLEEFAEDKKKLFKDFSFVGPAWAQ